MLMLRSSKTSCLVWTVCVVRDFGELDESIRIAFYNNFCEDIPGKGEIGNAAPSSFDNKEFEDFSVEEIITGPPK